MNDPYSSGQARSGSGWKVQIRGCIISVADSSLIVYTVYNTCMEDSSITDASCLEMSWWLTLIG